ncbi:MAG: GPH family glycoside/pentoside/hexuronide:cation symporter [Verrucomicrobiales bacterium]|jgi:GPH family glycoside/pentoside/hexuronide:cation symporter
MSETTKNTVPFGQKLAFGFGMLANQMFPAAMGVFLVVLVQDLGFSPLAWGLIFFAPRLFDAITDPIMGFISDNTRSRWGRRRQYVFVGGLIMGISYIAMWQLHRDNSISYNFIYFLSMSLVFYLGLTIFSVPFVAMGYEMSSDFHERTNIMAVAQFIGQWAWVIAPWFWVILYDPDWFPSADAGVRQLSVWVAIPCSILAIVPAIFIKSKSTEHRTDFKPINLKSIGSSLGDIAKSTREAFSIPQFRKLAFATFLVFNSFNVIAAFTFFIIVHHLFGGAAEKAGVWPALHGCVGALITTFLVIPIVAAMAKKIGKKKAFLISQAISMIGYILFWFLFVPGKPYLFLFALPFHSFGIGSLFTLMMSMTADVCDLDELNSGKRREGIIGAVYWWMVKFGGAFAGLLGGLIMTFVGFDPGGEVTESAITGMRLAYTILPIAGVLGAILIMRNYDLSEVRAAEVRQQLADKKATGGTTLQNQ